MIKDIGYGILSAIATISIVLFWIVQSNAIYSFGLVTGMVLR